MGKKTTISGELGKAATGLLGEMFSQVTGIKARKKKKRKKVVKTYYMGKPHGIWVDGKYYKI